MSEGAKQELVKRGLTLYARDARTYTMPATISIGDVANQKLLPVDL